MQFAYKKTFKVNYYYGGDDSNVWEYRRYIDITPNDGKYNPVEYAQVQVKFDENGKKSYLSYDEYPARETTKDQYEYAQSFKESFVDKLNNIVLDNTIMIGDGIVITTADGVIHAQNTNSLEGGVQNDKLYGSSGDDVLDGGDGDDTITSQYGNNTLNGGSGNDTIGGGIGNNTISSGAGIDTIVVGDGDNKITLGDDNLEYENRANTLNNIFYKNYQKIA